MTRFASMLLLAAAVLGAARPGYALSGREVIDSIRLSVVDGAAKGRGLKDYVAVREEEPFACGTVRSELESVVFAEPAGREEFHAGLNPAVLHKVRLVVADENEQAVMGHVQKHAGPDTAGAPAHPVITRSKTPKQVTDGHDCHFLARKHRHRDR